METPKIKYEQLSGNDDFNTAGGQTYVAGFQYNSTTGKYEPVKADLKDLQGSYVPYETLALLQAQPSPSIAVGYKVTNDSTQSNNGFYHYDGSSFVKDFGDEGYQFRGIATPTTSPATATTEEYYIASQAGAYSNFGVNISKYGLYIILWNGSAWELQQVIDIETLISDLELEIEDITSAIEANEEQIALNTITATLAL